MKRTFGFKLKWAVCFGFFITLLFAQVPFGARMNGGKIHYRDGRYKKAKELFELALKERPNSAEAHFWLGLALAQLGEVLTAAEHFLSAFQLDPSYLNLAKKEEDKKFLVWSAFSQKTQKLLLAESYETALPYAQMCIQIDEAQPTGYTLLSQVYAQLNKLEDLFRLGEDLIARDSLSPQGYNILGIYFFTKAIWDSAALVYEKSLKLYEDRIEVHKENLKKELKRADAELVIRRLVQYQENKDVSGFQSYVEDSLRLKPKLGLLARLTLELYNTILEKNFAQFRTGTAYLQKSAQGEESLKILYLKKAEAAFANLLAQTPEDIDAKYNLGFVKYSLGKEKVEEACGIFRELVLTGRLITQLEEKEKEEISLLLTKEKGKSAIPLPPEIASSIGNGNFVYIYLFDTLSPFLSPLPPATLENLYLLLGASYVRVADLKKEKGYYDSAITSFQRVIILNPENTDAYQNLVVAYREKGDKKMAEKMYLKMEEIKKRKGQK